MDFSNIRLRNNILNIIKECSSSANIQERNSLGYAAIDVRKLYDLIKKRYNVDAIDILHYLPNTSIKTVIDFIISLFPNEVNLSDSKTTTCQNNNSLLWIKENTNI